jgi:glycosyltransferase involved in cell wall biosynthesis
MLRVLILSTRYPDAGRPNFGNFVQRQMQELARRPGVELEVVAPLRLTRSTTKRELALLPAEEVWHGLRVHRPRFRPPPYLRQLQPWALTRVLLPLAKRVRERFPFDVISAEFAWPEGPAAVAVGRALGVPVSMKARGADFELNVTRPAVRRQLIRSGCAADGLLAVSEAVKQVMVRCGLAETDIAVHYPAVDLERFRPIDRAAAKADLRLSGPVLLTVGNLTKTKGQKIAVGALAFLPNATLLIIGAGPEEAELRRQIARLGLTERVRMFGSIPHELLPTFYSAADVMVHCPSVEGFPNVRLEALACGTPLVTTAVGDAERTVSTAEAGRIVKADPTDVASAVLDLLRDPPPRQTVRAAAKEFSWTRSTSQLEAHFRALVGAQEADL